LYFVFYHSLELDLIWASDDNDHASYKGLKCLGYAWMFVCLFSFLRVVVVVLVMERNKLLMVIKSESFKR
jgi:hypothetical protein